MTGRTTRVRTATILALACAVVIAGAGLFAWWNTDLLGQDDFCAGAVPADDAGAVLDGPGRLTLASAEPQRCPATPTVSTASSSAAASSSAVIRPASP
ncbi:hypothetical protein [Streptomyces griseus]|uniref:hypothetical protein n=1 Tax=Streptomyces griseus TaxID=1911 RepID=UPI0036A42968